MAAGTIPFYAWGFDVVAANRQIAVKEGNPLGAEFTANMALGTHYPRGNGAADDLLAVFKTALEAAIAGALNYTVVFLDNTGRIRVQADNQFRLMISSANWKPDPQEFGFSAAAGSGNPADDRQAVFDAGSGKWRLDSDTQVKRGWFPELAFTDDTENYPEARSAGGVAMDGITTRAVRWGLQHPRKVLHDLVPVTKVYTAEEGRLNAAFERFYEWYTTGAKFEFHQDRANPSAGSTVRYVILADSHEWPARLPEPTLRRWWINLNLLKTT